MTEAVKKYSGADYNDWNTDEDARECAKRFTLRLPKTQQRERFGRAV